MFFSMSLMEDILDWSDSVLDIIFVLIFFLGVFSISDEHYFYCTFTVNLRL